MCGIALAIGKNSDAFVSSMMGGIGRRGICSYLFDENDWSVGFAHLPITAREDFVQYGVDDQLVFLNGFISNHEELALRYNVHLKSSCDTELVAKLLYKYGEDAFTLFNGFFSIAWFDGDKWIMKTDRWGIKQLYHFKDRDIELFCSNVKGILKALNNSGKEINLNPQAIEDWMHSLGVVDPNTIYSGINRVEPLFGFNYPAKFKRLSVDDISYEDAKDQLMHLWKMSVNRNKVNNLKSGVFLSGGIDSGMIAKHLPVDYSFSVDYLDDEKSEINTIKENTQGIHLVLMDSIPLCNKYKELTLDALDDPRVGCCYTNYALTELASNFVTVLYSGAGGDELFGGYPHRNNKPIEQVIKRTRHFGEAPFEINMSHDEYNFSYLRGIFIVEDRMTGHFAMEARYPLMDNEFAEFALSLPLEYVEEKRILKDISGLSEKVINAKKRGFISLNFTNDDWTTFVITNKRDEHEKQRTIRQRLDKH